MSDYKIGCDAHKRFSQFKVRDATDRLRSLWSFAMTGKMKREGYQGM